MLGALSTLGSVDNNINGYVIADLIPSKRLLKRSIAYRISDIAKHGHTLIDMSPDIYESLSYETKRKPRKPLSKIKFNNRILKHKDYNTLENSCKRSITKISTKAIIRRG